MRETAQRTPDCRFGCADCVWELDHLILKMRTPQRRWERLMDAENEKDCWSPAMPPAKSSLRRGAAAARRGTARPTVCPTPLRTSGRHGPPLCWARKAHDQYSDRMPRLQAVCRSARWPTRTLAEAISIHQKNSMYTAGIATLLGGSTPGQPRCSQASRVTHAPFP